MAMKRTLLEMTKDILVSLDGDDVSAITDTAEASQVASIIRQCFYEIASNQSLPEHQTFFELVETSASTPTIFTKPADVISISWIKYDVKELLDTNPVYRELQLLPKDDFFSMQDMINIDEPGSASFDYTIGSDTFPFKHRSDTNPTYYTSFDDNTIVVDSYNSSIEPYLKKSKTWCYGIKESVWTHSDSFVPPLDHRLSNLLFQSAKAQCFLELKQVENLMAERKTKRAMVTLDKYKNDINNDNAGYYYNKNQLPNYGRKC